MKRGLCGICRISLKWNEDGDIISVDEHQEISTYHIRQNQNLCYWCGLISFMLIPGRDYVKIKLQADSPWSSDLYRDLQSAQVVEYSPFDVHVLRFEYIASSGEDWSYLGAIDTCRRSSPMHPLKEQSVRPGRFGMPIISNKIDSEAIIGSMDACKRKCSDARNVANSRYVEPIVITLVDTVKMCLVDSTTDEDYICLSYVWGTTSSARASSHTRVAWREVGALRSLAIAPLITDAIELVGRLLKRYLWVDQLCIEQDNTSQQHSQIRQMDIMYHQSILTLIAWASTNADDRIPGLNSADIQWSYSSMAALGNTAARAHFPLGESIQLDSVVYRSRGWTLQEEWLAPRRLYLGHYAIHYHCSICHAGQNCEETFHCNSANLHKQLAFKSASSRAFNLYIRAVWRFSKRRLTMQSDTLHAFAGIYGAIGLDESGDSRSGLPAALLGQMLFWDNVASNSNLERNLSFPSWSWAGWVGPVVPTLLAQCELLAENLHFLSTPESTINSLNPLAVGDKSMNLLCFAAETAVATNDCVAILEMEANMSRVENARSCLFDTSAGGSRNEILILMGRYPMDRSKDLWTLVLWLVGRPQGKRPERLALLKTTPERWNSLERKRTNLELA